jgi:imidazolonepropionase-like amidohydrolase
MKKAVAPFLSVPLLIWACSVAPDIPNSLFIQNISLIDGTGRGIQRDMDLLIREGLIKAVGRKLSVPQGAQVVNGTGKFAIPGLIDVHVHLDAPVVSQLSSEERAEIITYNPKAFLYNGVTTVLNLGSPEDWIWKIRQIQRRGGMIGPRIYAVGESFSPRGGWGYGDGSRDADSAREKALNHVKNKTDGFKIVLEDGLGRSGKFREMPEDMLNTIVRVAREFEIPLYVHAINIEEYRRAVAIRPRAIVHGLEDPISVEDPILQEIISGSTIIVPTHSLFESFVGMAKNFNDPILRSSVPGFLIDKMQDESFMEEERRQFIDYARMKVYGWVRDKLPIFGENIAKMHQAGVKLAVGTDAGGQVGYNFQGYNTPWEVELLVKVGGLTPMEALQAATRNGAEVIGVQDKLGTLETGKWADLLVLEGNPLEDIRNIRDIEFVVQAGQIHNRADFAVGN